MSETRDIVVKVTQDDIDRGNKSTCSTCPIALAVCRALGCEPMDETRVEVGVYMAHIGRASVPLPEIAQQFIYSFDEGKSVSPIEFPLVFDEIPFPAKGGAA